MSVIIIVMDVRTPLSPKILSLVHSFPLALVICLHDKRLGDIATNSFILFSLTTLSEVHSTVIIERMEDYCTLFEISLW
jgi:hypothetical protein